MELVYILLFVVLIIILFILGSYNNLIVHQNRVKKAKANIEVALKKRFDLIPNLVECVKGYSKYEKETLKEIVILREEYQNKESLNIEEVQTLDEKLTKYLIKIEDYPELKADKNYLHLQEELSTIEDELSDARRRYNNDVTSYNTLVESVPNNIVAALFAFRKTDLFRISEEEKENIKIRI